MINSNIKQVLFGMEICTSSRWEGERKKVKGGMNMVKKLYPCMNIEL
jgi:hypothetical protein